MLSFCCLPRVFIILFPGVKSILVGLLAATAEVNFDPIVTDPSKIAESITDLGFPTLVLDTGSSSSQPTVEVKVSQFKIPLYFIIFL